MIKGFRGVFVYSRVCYHTREMRRPFKSHVNTVNKRADRLLPIRSFVVPVVGLESRHDDAKAAF